MKLIREFIRSTDGGSDKGALETFLKYLNKHETKHETHVEDWWILSECFKLSGDFEKAQDLLKKTQKIILDDSKIISNEIHRKCFLEEQIFNKKVFN